MISEEVEVRGHLIDSKMLSRILDTILYMGGDFSIEKLEVGKTHRDKSYARILVLASGEKLAGVVSAIRKMGASPLRSESVRFGRAPRGGVLPDGFYSTTNLETWVNLGDWVKVGDQRMDAAIIVEGRRARCRKMCDVRKGEKILIGDAGVRVVPLEQEESERARNGDVFSFMVSGVSSERDTSLAVRQIAGELKWLKKKRGKVLVVVGPAVVHTGGERALASIIRKGYVNGVLSGNATAVHDLEKAMFGTSLGVCASTGKLMSDGSSRHIRAINEIKKHGSIKRAVEARAIRKGIFYECVKNKVPFVLAGSIRDDGPLPEVITDVMKAQKEYARLLKDAELVLMLSSTLHSVAVGNMLPARVRTICVDINPATVTKLIDRGSAQARGIVTDVGLFLRELNRVL